MNVSQTLSLPAGEVAVRVPVSKAHAYGNDFLMVPQRNPHADLARLARAMCHRHHGIGADGLIFYDLRESGATMRLYNADGSASELSGNGLRCLAALVARAQQLEPGTTVTVDTDAGVKSLELLERARGALYVPRRAGRADRTSPGADSRARRNGDGVGAGMGNPQCVVLGPLPATDRSTRSVPRSRRTRCFPPARTSSSPHVEAPDRVRILIWERGVGPTTSSGTGASASAVAAAAHGGAGRAVDVVAPGGTQRVEWKDDGVYLTGWATLVLDGSGGTCGQSVGLR